MKITRMGHAALLVESDSDRILIDPGTFTDSWHDLEGLTAILITHQHHDHVDSENVAHLAGANPGVTVAVEEAVAPMLGEFGVEPRTVRPGDELSFGGLSVGVVGGRHARIHDRIPVVGNVGFVIAESDGSRLFHPGDSYEYLVDGIDLLALPLTGPWTSLAMTVDFLNGVAPRKAFAIHDATLNQYGLNSFHRLVTQLAEENTDFVVVDPTGSFDL